MLRVVGSVVVSLISKITGRDEGGNDTLWTYSETNFAELHLGVVAKYVLAII